MVTLRLFWRIAALLAILLAPIHRLAGAEPVHGGDLTIAIADFSGSDKEIGRFVADTLLTDLAQSKRLQLVGQAEVERALTELKLQASGLTDPQQVRKVGARIGVDHLIVGSYLIHDNQLTINARLLDAHTGRVMPGSAANVTGARDALLPLVHRLAHLFHIQVTGKDLVLGGETGRQSTVSPDDPAHTAATEEEQPYTSVIIDMHGRRVARDIVPKIRRADRSKVWSIWDTVNIDADYMTEHGIVAYAHSLVEAKKLSRAGSHPLVLPAVADSNSPVHDYGMHSDADAVISNEDADRLLRLNELYGFLDRCNVIFVVGRGR